MKKTSLWIKKFMNQGHKPQLYNKECLERALAKNEQVKGKIKSDELSNTVPVFKRRTTILLTSLFPLHLKYLFTELTFLIQGA